MNTAILCAALALLHQPDITALPDDLRQQQSHDPLDAQRRCQRETLDDRKLGAGRLVEARLLPRHSDLRSSLSFPLKITSDYLSCFLPGTSADSTSPAELVIRRSKLAHGAVDGAVRHPAIDRLVVVAVVDDEAVPALGDDEDIGRPDLEVLRASEAKTCDVLIEIGGRMDEVCESCHKVF